MKRHQIESGSISLDRLIILKERVSNTIKEYETLLITLEKAFKNSNTEHISTLTSIKEELDRTLTKRVRIFKAYAKDLKKNNYTITDHENELYTKLESLYNTLSLFKETLVINKAVLSRELRNVNKIVRPLGRLRDQTAWRIDITA